MKRQLTDNEWVKVGLESSNGARVLAKRSRKTPLEKKKEVKQWSKTESENGVLELCLEFAWPDADFQIKWKDFLKNE